MGSTAPAAVLRQVQLGRPVPSMSRCIGRIGISTMVGGRPLGGRAGSGGGSAHALDKQNPFLHTNLFYNV